jgi:hypothetical protein
VNAKYDVWYTIGIAAACSKGHSFGHAKHARRSRHRVFREPVAVRHPDHAIADAERRHPFAHRVDHARDLSSRREGKRRFHLILALHLQNVEEIQRGRLRCDAHLVPAGRFGRRRLFEPHGLGLAPIVYSPGSHAYFPLKFGLRFS